MDTNVGWNGKQTPELDAIEEEYFRRFNMWADLYDAIDYENMTYEEYFGHIRTCLDKNITMDELMDRIDTENVLCVISKLIFTKVTTILSVRRKV